MKNNLRGLYYYAMAMAITKDVGLEVGLDPEEKPEPFSGKSKEEINKAKGMKEFNYPDGTIWARNKKNADRKAKNKGWIILLMLIILSSCTRKTCYTQQPTPHFKNYKQCPKW